MMDMSYDDEDAKSFIVDILLENDEVVVKYASGEEKRFKYTEHTLNYYRRMMIKGAEDHIQDALDEVGRESFKTYAIKYGSVILSLVGMYFAFNFDIHIVIRIILMVLLALGEIAYWLYQQMYLLLCNDDALELLATEEYLKDPNASEYYSKKKGEYVYAFPIEDISRYNLTQDQVKKIQASLSDLRRSGRDLDEIHVEYKKEEGNSLVK